MLPYDYIFIEDFQISSKIGTTAEERAFPQVVNLSCRIELPLHTAGKSDHLSDTIDYAAVINEIQLIVTSHEFNLVETLAETVAEHLLKHKMIEAVDVRISKNVFPQVKSVGAFIRRTKNTPT
jgi:7,8-dihydroneopterin aldolase/epimerase/oxygenase